MKNKKLLFQETKLKLDEKAIELLMIKLKSHKKEHVDPNSERVLDISI